MRMISLPYISENLFLRYQPGLIIIITDSLSVQPHHNTHNINDDILKEPKDIEQPQPSISTFFIPLNHMVFSKKNHMIYYFKDHSKSLRNKFLISGRASIMPQQYSTSACGVHHFCNLFIWCQLEPVAYYIRSVTIHSKSI